MGRETRDADERGTLEAGARRLRPPKRGSLETERGKTGAGGRGRVRGAGGIKGVARQRAVSTASPSEARMGRRGSNAALSGGRTARRAGLVNAHRWKEGRKRTATGDALNAAFRLNRENRVCLEADADSLLLHVCLFLLFLTSVSAPQQTFPAASPH